MLCQGATQCNRATVYTGEVSDRPPPEAYHPTLRSEQVAQTRAALVDAGRRLFGRQGFAATSVNDLAREARVTTGALYHHFPTKTALFETVFESIHAELLEASARAAGGSTDAVEFLARGLEAFLDAVMDPEVQRIVVTDAPAVLGQGRSTELDERHSLGPMVASLRAAAEAGAIQVDDPETMALLFFGALSRGALLIAASADPRATRDAVATSVRALLKGLVPPDRVAP
jgi:AcrR family transcriptional regulator